MKYGSMNPVRMYDRGTAIVAAILSRVNGGKAEPEDFFLMERQDEKVVDEDEFLNALMTTGKVQIGKRR